MQPEFLKLIPDKYRQMLAEAQVLTKSEIRVFTPQEPKMWFQIINGYPVARDQPTAIIESQIAAIAVPNTQMITPRVLAHEIKHIHLSWVEGFPSAKPVDTQIKSLSRIAAGWSNDLQHLAMLPMEFQEFPESADIWDQRWRDAVKAEMEVPASKRPGQSRVLGIMPFWIQSSLLLPKGRAKKACRRALEKLDAFQFAQDHLAEFKKAWPDPAASYAVVLQGLPSDAINLEVTDPVQKRYVLTPLKAPQT